MSLLLFCLFILFCINVINNYPDKDINLKYKIHDNKTVTIYNGYLILNINHMIEIIIDIEYKTPRHRSYLSLITEWYCHNIVVYICNFLIRLHIDADWIMNLYSRAADVDLENF